ncbi:MAG: hypothetical protein KDD06_20360 [Phaeodactylibacter sp.]|nr:hypothetical protein [Phaeodactylibacter sp.]MCB9287183.1 hypothetical protein [Lewinellaceae bacterium]
MFRKLAILTALLVAGALFSSLFAELATGKPLPLPAAEECTFSLSDSDTGLLSDFDGGSPAFSCIPPQRFLSGGQPASSGPMLLPGSRTSTIKTPLFLLFHVFLFYDSH